MKRKLQGEPNPGRAGEQRDYISYLLRLWRMDGDDEALGCDHPRSFLGNGSRGWRASLESPVTGERLGFGCLEDLFGFLRAQAGPLRSAPADQGRGHG